MYRAFKFGRHVFHPNLVKIQQSRFKCSLCNKTSDHKIVTGPFLTLTTCYTTRTSAQYVTEHRRKKKNRRNILYTELLEVSEKNTSETRKKVTTLHANSLLKMDSHLDVGLDRNLTDDIDKNLPIFINKLGTFSDDGTHEELEEIAVNHDIEIEKPEVIEEPSVVPLISNKNKKFNLSTKNKEILAAIKQGEMEIAGKQKALNLCLVSYMDLCMSCGFLNRGLATLHYYLNNTQTPKITNLRIFNNLMEGCAKKGQTEKLFEVWELMKTKTDLRPSARSFASRFEAIALTKKRNKTELINSTLRLMESEGITLNDMFSQCVWRGNSRETVLGAIRVVRPFFAPLIQPPEVLYSSELLQHLNKPPEKRLISPAESILSSEDLKKSFKEQLELEKRTYIEINSIEKQPQLTDEILFYRKQLESLKAEWERNISAALNRDLSAMAYVYKSVKKNQGQFNIYPYLVVLDKQHYIEIIIKELCRLADGSETYSLTAATLCKILGMQVKLRYNIKKKTSDGISNKIALLYEEHIKWYLNPGNEATNARHNWELLKYKHLEGPSVDVEDHTWPHTLLVGVGRFLYNIILKEIKIDVNIMKKNSSFKRSLPAFYRLFRIQNNVNKEELKPHPVLSRLLRAAQLPQLTFSATELPMVTPPIPWSTINTGGYLVLRAPLLRLPGEAVQQLERLNEVPLSQLYPCFDSLNQLAYIPWKVNKSILDIVIEVFNSGGDLKLDIPIPPTSFSLPEMSTSANKTERTQLFRARLLAKRKRAEMFSLWCDALYRLSLANHYRDRVFWLPHNMDFRGRVYPLPPHLSHLGSDMSRALLVFAKGKPLGPCGLDWLKIHLVNLTGLKKRDSIAERLEYANSILPKILDSANNPLNGMRWWTESEEPWQTLACCLEVRDALLNPGGPQGHISHFPVHQDGSCNGLQHYAALGRDTAGGFSVNLSPSPVPQDVYSCVASMVEEQRSEDAQRGVLVAKILEGFVRRKVIKQTVMTTVYGVTRYGARLQIAKRLKDIDEFPKEHVWQASSYLVMKTFDSLREMFTSTREIQDWFTESARMIAKTRGENVEYVTPLGLPVVQPYSRSSPASFSEADLRGVVSVNNSYDQFERPNVMKQKNAFPPNFIHSLDSSHMMLTSLHCEREGLTFVSVHDCYWTHPCSVETMNKICREQFVTLHSQPILQDLSNFLIKKYGYDEREGPGSEVVALARERLNETLKRVPPKGDFKLENVLESVYFFS